MDISAGEILNFFLIIFLVGISFTFTNFRVFSGKTFYSRSASQSPHRCINGYRRIERYDGLAFHPEGSRNTPSRFMLLEPKISISLMMN